MKGLLIKDIRLMKIQAKFFVMIIFISLVISTMNADPTFAIGFMGFVGSMFTMSTISYDEFDNGHAFLFTLPISRNSYVIEKYCFGLLLGFASWLVGTALSLVSIVVIGRGDVKGALLAALLILPMIILLFSFMAPFQIKYGGEKGRLVMIGAVGIIMIISFIATKLIDQQALIQLLNALLENMYLTIAVLIVVTLLVFGVSLMSSLVIMNKKQF
ncbi:hypothetical protein BAU15_06555 [Enterococcus sp. JM4C]|uniref:ABC-2 transporter permease n=1 Tax=Candidatus Enterococcus huntleyi TaxID=1857217 RepID=UPI001379C9B3|nr:ABC-2 transporter permease [Enterococcus sp. JM4C]KAF1297204.1 hypothetical protein BAU15_06555 [Enterococcus sp. JM4C]